VLSRTANSTIPAGFSRIHQVPQYLIIMQCLSEVCFFGFCAALRIMFPESTIIFVVSEAFFITDLVTTCYPESRSESSFIPKRRTINTVYGLKRNFPTVTAVRFATEGSTFASLQCESLSKSRLSDQYFVIQTVPPPRPIFIRPAEAKWKI
jgi:hypothetical protein